MTTDTSPAAATRDPYQAYAAEERRLRDTYIAAVRDARDTYAAATRPARNAYDRAEQAAWQAYYHATRWNYRTYQAKCGMTPGGAAAVTPAVTPPVPDDGAVCGCDIPQPRPTFTPNHGSE